MKQGETKRLKLRDKHLSASWKKRDEGRKGKQESFAAAVKVWTDPMVREALLAAGESS